MLILEIAVGIVIGTFVVLFIIAAMVGD